VDFLLTAKGDTKKFATSPLIIDRTISPIHPGADATAEAVPGLVDGDVVVSLAEDGEVARQLTRNANGRFFAVGGELGSRLSHRLAMPISGDTLLRMVRSTRRHRRLGLASWLAIWNEHLERNCVLDLLPDRSADSVARQFKRCRGSRSSPAIVRDFFADGAWRGEPDAVQVADRWHLLNSLGEALRHVVGRHRHAVAAAAQIMVSRARGHASFTTMRTVLFLIAGTLTFTSINPYAAI